MKIRPLKLRSRSKYFANKYFSRNIWKIKQGITYYLGNSGCWAKKRLDEPFKNLSDANWFEITIDEFKKKFPGSEL